MYKDLDTPIIWHDDLRLQLTPFFFFWQYLRYVEVIVFLLIFLQWILLASTPIYTNTDKTSFGGTNIHYIILAIQCVYRYVASMN
jgi:hypothetical protein